MPVLAVTRGWPTDAELAAMTVVLLAAASAAASAAAAACLSTSGAAPAAPAVGGGLTHTTALPRPGPTAGVPPPCRADPPRKTMNMPAKQPPPLAGSAGLAW